jgi:hypothetical protein
VLPQEPVSKQDQASATRGRKCYRDNDAKSALHKTQRRAGLFVGREGRSVVMNSDVFS